MNGAAGRVLLAAAVALAAAAAPRLASAQGVPTRRPPADSATRPRPDTLRVRGDSVLAPTPGDSLYTDSSRVQKREAVTKAPVVKADSLRAPTAHSEAPALLDAGQPYRWNREELFASGAVTLLDLLDRVPGLSGLRSGFLAQPEAGAYVGDVGRVRVFMDGLEIDGIDPRASNVLDLASIQLWTLEDVAVERSARELRVYTRTWRTQTVTPYTRTDALTGDQRLTMFRGFYGKRTRHGEVAQFGVQQFGLGDPRSFGGSSLALNARLGWARRGLSVDAYGERVRRDIDPVTYALDPTNGIPGERGTYTRAYLRAAAGDPDAGPWLQAIAGTLRYLESTPTSSTPAVGADSADRADTNSSRAQYVLAGGFTRGAARLSATDRVRVFQGLTRNDLIARATLDTRLASLGGYAEANGLDSLTRLELSARLRPLGVLSISGTATRSSPTSGSVRPASTDFRLEGAVRVGRGGSVGGGVLFRDSSLTTPVTLFNDVPQPVRVGQATGAFVSIRGRLYRSIYADAYALRWNAAGTYMLPQYETRTELYLSTRWLSRFPSGNFGFTASIAHEYRSSTVFVDRRGELVTVDGSHVPTVLVELRIASAVVSYQYRDFLRERYSLVPGALMPTGVNFYGVRWEFFN